jgi:hypothetical protein
MIKVIAIAPIHTGIIKAIEPILMEGAWTLNMEVMKDI